MKHDWEYKKLGDICDFERGLTYSKNDESSLPTENKVFRSNNVDLETKKIVLDDLKYLVSDFVIPDTKMVKPQTILMCMSNGSMQHVGKVAHIEEKYDAAFGGFMGLLIPKQNCRSKYLFYFLNSATYRHFLLSIANGINITNLKFSDLRNLNLPVPPLPIQQQIVDELDKLSEIIEKKKQQVKELDTLAQSIFYDMFGDPVENEKGWEVKSMGDIGTLQRGSGLSKKVLVEDGYPCILYGQIHTRFGAYTKKHVFCIPNELVHTAKIAHPNDLIMAITSEDVEGSCKSTAWLGDYDIAVGSDAAIFSHNQNSIYVSYYTKTKAFYNEKEKYARGFKVTHISTKEIATIPILLPPLPLQQSFAQKIEAIEKQKELINQSIKETQTLFDSRMDYYFGE